MVGAPAVTLRSLRISAAMIGSASTPFASMAPNLTRCRAPRRPREMLDHTAQAARLAAGEIDRTGEITFEHGGDHLREVLDIDEIAQLLAI